MNVFIYRSIPLIDQYNQFDIPYFFFVVVDDRFSNSFCCCCRERKNFQFFFNNEQQWQNENIFSRENEEKFFFPKMKMLLQIIQADSLHRTHTHTCGANFLSFKIQFSFFYTKMFFFNGKKDRELNMKTTTTTVN